VKKTIRQLADGLKNLRKDRISKKTAKNKFHKCESCELHTKHLFKRYPKAFLFQIVQQVQIVCLNYRHRT
jgi:hypothetical protein